MSKTIPQCTRQLRNRKFQAGEHQLKQSHDAMGCQQDCPRGTTDTILNESMAGQCQNHPTMHLTAGNSKLNCESAKLENITLSNPMMQQLRRWPRDASDYENVQEVARHRADHTPLPAAAVGLATGHPKANPSMHQWVTNIARRHPRNIRRDCLSTRTTVMAKGKLCLRRWKIQPIPRSRFLFFERHLSFFNGYKSIQGYACMYI